MTDAVVTALREIANRDLYQRNAFHVTALPTNADRRTTRRRQQHVIAVLEAGADLETTGSRDPDELRIAFDRLLGDPRRRMVDEVFGEWGRPNGDCGCDVPTHRAHDEAVYAHATAVEMLIAPAPPSEYEDMWRRACERWTAAMHDPQFWQHLRNRVLTLDDWQLAAAAVDQIRGELPRTLTGPLLDLAANGQHPERTSEALEHWEIPGHRTEQWLLDTLRPQYERNEDAVLRLLRRQQGKPDLVDEVVAELEQSVLPGYRRLQVLLPSAEHQRTRTLRDDIALVYHNGAVELVNHLGVSPRVGPLLMEAKEFAVGPEMQAKVEEALRIVVQLAFQESARPLSQPGDPDASGCGATIVAFVIIAALIFLLVKVFG
ncbi:hypothetical protein ACIA49_00475 [Kribbella sp. NPDC051587]|uniref:hypothetical protein n=1 Tax=Kribbella sp. NPDC051587 TaxID=3364119 RepID=UPI0037A9D098